MSFVTYKLFTEDNEWQVKKPAITAPTSLSTRLSLWQEFCSPRSKSSLRARTDRESSKSGKRSRGFRPNHNRTGGAPKGICPTCFIYMSASLSKTILRFTTVTRISFLHLGQNKGNFTRTVSPYTFVRVFPLQMGQ